MSYYRCNNEYEHEREGRDAARWGRMPDWDYRDQADRDSESCGAAYMDAYRSEERRMDREREERAEEERQERRAYEQRRQAEAEEAAYEQQAYEEESQRRAEYEAAMEEEYQRSLRLTET